MGRIRQVLFALWFCALITYGWFNLQNTALMASLAFMLPVIFRYTFFFVFAFVLFSFFRIHEAFPALMPYDIPELLAIASLLGLSWKMWSSPKTFKWHRLHTLYFYFVGWIALTIPFATNIPLAYGYYTNVFIKIIIMTFAISWIPSELKQILRVPSYLFLCSALICSVAIYNRINGIGLVEGTRVTIGRDIGSLLGDPNDLALILQVPLCFAMLHSLEGSKTKRFITIIITLMLIGTTLITQSRGGLLSMSTATVMVIYLKAKRKILAFSIMGSLGFLMVLAMGIGDRLLRSNEQGIGESAMGRLYAWEAAWKMALSNPLTGVGMDNFYNNYYLFTPHWDGKNHAVHSTWFEVLSETGFIGFTLFAILLYGVLVQSRRLVRRLQAQDNKAAITFAESIWVSYIALSISSTFLTQAFTWPLYILLGLLLALERLIPESDQTYAEDLKETPHTTPIGKT